MNDQETRKIFSPLRSLAEYDILSPIGRGANSFVYKVLFKPENQVYAMKVLEIKKPGDEQKILQEIHIHSRLQHSHIVQYKEHFKEEDKYYLILEYCERGELYGEIIQRCSKERAKQIFHQILNALCYL